MSKKILLNELTTNNDDRIKDAINNVRRVRITYNDKKPHVISNRKGYKTRYILPVAYGLLKNGKKAIRAYQTYGSTKRGIPKWKLFLLDNIITWQNSTRTFKKYKQALIDLGLNINGDKHMTTLYAITPFANPDVQISKYDNEITPEPILKTDVEPTVNNQNPNFKNNKTKSASINQKTIRNIDNINKNHYYINDKNTQNEPSKSNNDLKINKETEPIINTQNITNNNINDKTNINNGNITPVDNTPVTKSEIEGSEEDIKNNVLTNTYNDLMSRMDNLNNNDEEN